MLSSLCTSHCWGQATSYNKRAWAAGPKDPSRVETFTLIKWLCRFPRNVFPYRKFHGNKNSENSRCETGYRTHDHDYFFIVLQENLMIYNYVISHCM